MELRIPSIVTGVINGDEDAWSRACCLLGEYYQPALGLRSCIDTTVSGDPYADDTVLTGTDIVALRALGMTVSDWQAQALINDSRLARLLADVPAMMDLVDADDDFIGPGSAAARLWEYLTEPALYGLGWKKAEALLARMRPRLFPVVTGAERKAWGLSKNMPAAWLALRDVLRRDDARLAYQLYYLIQTAPVWSELAQVQVLQALIYTDYQQRKEATGAAGNARARQKARKRSAKQARKLQAARARAAAQHARGTQPTGSSHPGGDISTDAFRLN